MKNGILITALSAVLAGCNLPFAAAPTPTSTATLVPSITPLPTFTARPSSTPEPTRTPRPFASATVEGTLAPATPTLPYLEPLDTPTASSGLNCKLVWQSPKDNVRFKPREDFSTGWKVTNIGSATWRPGSVEFTYMGGSKLHRYPVLQLESSVGSGQSVVLSVEMRAPKNSTKYTTYWSLRQGDVYFCRLALSIYVKEDPTP